MVLLLWGLAGKDAAAMLGILTRRQGGSQRAAVEFRKSRGRERSLFIVLSALAAGLARGENATGRLASPTPGVSYTNYLVPKAPWSIHVVRIDRANAPVEFHSAHANAGALGLSPLTAHIKRLSAALGAPVAAVNGDFYQRDRAYAGDPRGLQIVDGEVISAPIGAVTFWIDAFGHPHATNVASRFEVIWPGGAKTPFGLNCERPSNGVTLYTPALGPSTHTAGGRELVLERTVGSPWLPLRMGETYTARVREVREVGDTPLAPDTMVLSISPALARRLPDLKAGAEVRLVTASSPSLWGARTAIGGGPVLVRGRRPLKRGQPVAESYEFSSMLERHPRTAIGWSRTHFMLVEVDGRQRNLSVGMTLEELAAYLVKLGCEEAMNFDGGGSAILWYDGKVRNKPCDGYERPIANSLIVVRKPAAPGRRRLPSRPQGRGVQSEAEGMACCRSVQRRKVRPLSPSGGEGRGEGAACPPSRERASHWFSSPPHLNPLPRWERGDATTVAIGAKPANLVGWLVYAPASEESPVHVSREQS
jgi:hypothetical protein